jgi:integrase
MTTWAIRRKLARCNPFAGHSFRADGTRTEIIEGEAYHAIFAAIDDMEKDGRLPPVVARALRLIWATGARRSEVTSLRWRHVRIDDARIIIPALEHKGGRVAARQGREAISRSTPSSLNCQLQAPRRQQMRWSFHLCSAMLGNWS